MLGRVLRNERGEGFREEPNESENVGLTINEKVFLTDQEQ